MNFGLIGKSLAHSFSKTYFEEKFISTKKDNYTYTNFDLQNLDDLISIIRTNHLVGLNITKPYKESIIPFINELDVTAKIIGAVNCVKINYNNNTPYLIGYNTDYYGFAQSIKPFLEPTHQKALILGTGGASKAVEFALKQIGVDVYFVTTGIKKGTNYFLYSELNEFVFNSFKLIVNTTPLGMFPHTEECADITYQYINSEHLLFDLIYNPAETVFLKKGKEQGAIILNGLNMLKLQADKAWEIWNTT